MSFPSSSSSNSESSPSSNSFDEESNSSDQSRPKKTQFSRRTSAHNKGKLNTKTEVKCNSNDERPVGSEWHTQHGKKERRENECTDAIVPLK